MLASVMILEDDPTLRELLCTLLRDDGYAVHPVESVPSARTVLEQQPIDLLLADLVQYERHGGLGAAQELRQLAGSRPVVLCSGQPEARELCEQAGLDDVVLKPFDLDDLLARVRAVTAGLSAQGQS